MLYEGDNAASNLNLSLNEKNIREKNPDEFVEEKKVCVLLQDYLSIILPLFS